MAKYIAFDIETAKILPENVGNVIAHRPLGICCAAAQVAGEDQPQLWYGGKDDGKPSSQMSVAEAAAMVRDLAALVAEGATLLTWNGLGFDFDIVAEESGLWDECRIIARSHVDMMFHAFCELGYPISLDKASQGMGLAGKSKSVKQYEAPQLWADGKHQQVLEYVAQDVRATLDLAFACDKAKGLTWITAKGHPKQLPMSRGWLRVDDALKLPEPDTSWMDRPMLRSRFTDWLHE